MGFADLRIVEPRPFPELPTGVSIAMPFAEPSLAPIAARGVELLQAAGYEALGYGYETFFDQYGQDMNPEAHRRERGRKAGRAMCGLCLAACPFGKNVGDR